MSDKSGAGAISLPKGGGAISGMGEKFSPDLFTGTGNFSVPIALPPGRNGFQPELTLGYSTGNGNSAFGLGWNLGVPGVMRKTSKGIPRYDDEQDVFILSGAEDLVPIVRTELLDGIIPGHKIQYRPRTEGLFARIEHFKYQDGRNYWQVRSKDGLISYYGSETKPVTTSAYQANTANEAIIADPLHPANVFAWHLTRTVDPFGNDIVYRYTRERVLDGPHQYEQTYLRDIRYADYMSPAVGSASAERRYLLSVAFAYSDSRPDPFSTYDSGFEQRTTQRCTHIRTFTHPETADLPLGHAVGTGTEGNRNQVAVKTYAFRYADQEPATAQALNATSLLHQVEVRGHDDAAADPTKRLELMPPLEFSYSQFAPDLQRFAPVGGELPATSLADGNLELISIFGNGLPDLVELGSQQPRYWRNLGNGRFDLPRFMTEAPGGLQLADPDVQFIDANGDGKPDLLVSREGLAGYFPLNPDGQWDRKLFRKFKQRPSFSLADPEVRLLDLDGDGVTDVLRNGNRFEYFYNDPEQGFVATQQVNKSALDAFPSVSFQDPRVRLAHLCSGLQCIAMVYNGRVEYWPNLGRGRWGQRLAMRNSPILPRGYNPAHVLLGDVDGDGLDDFIYVQNNKITLWLNQSGNGWSAPIEITGTPPITDASAIRITDLLGTGVAGVLWTRDAPAVGRQQQYLFLDLTGRVKPYVLNQMDNHMGALTRVGYAPSTVHYLADQKKPATRWQTPLPFPVQVVSHVEVIDRLSGGKMTTEYSYHHGYWDGGEREFRGFGRVDQRDTQTFDRYNSDSLFAADTTVQQLRVPNAFERDGFEARDFQVDDILLIPSRLTALAEAAARPMPGDWDPTEFAAQDFMLNHSAPAARAGGVLLVAAEHYAPPLETRTWFHLGPVGDGTGEWRELDLSAEYWAEDPNLLQRPAGTTALLRGLRRHQRRDAIRTLRGSTLRTELYARDGSARQDQPYTVTESLPGLARVLLAPDGSGDVQLAFAPPPALAGFKTPVKPIFFSYGFGQRTTQWERGEDPMTQFSFTADYDNYGQARRQLSAAMPRGWERTGSAAGALVSGSVSTHAGYDERQGRNRFDLPGQYLVDRSCSSRSYEVVATAATAADYEQQTGHVLDWAALVADGLDEAGLLPRNLLGHSLQYYDGPAFAGLGFGELDLYGALTRSEVLTLTDAIAQQAYGTITPTLLEEYPSWAADYPQEFQEYYTSTYPNGRAGYQHSDATAPAELISGGYYQATERRQYDFQMNPTNHRGTVRARLDPLGTIAGATATISRRVSRATYDRYDLLTTNLVDALGHETIAAYDYRVLQTSLVTDANGNRTGYGFTPLGFLHKTGMLGKYGLREGDIISEQPLRYEPSSWLEYDFFAFMQNGQPTRVCTVQREQHYAVSTSSGTFVKVDYSDGFGRLLQTRLQAEDVIFGDATLGDSGLSTSNFQSNQAAVGMRRAATAPLNVVVNGWQVYDNKGRVVEKYEPFFSQDFAFVLDDAVARGQRVRLFYDPRGQVVRTINADATEQRTVYGTPGSRGLAYLEEFVPSPWETYTYDANDLAGLTHPGNTSVPTAHRFTPRSALLDALGRTVQTVDRLEPASSGGPLSEVVMQFTYDLLGNRTKVTDALRRDSFVHVYDLRPKMSEEGPGANIIYTRHVDGGEQRLWFDAASQPLQSRNERGTLMLQAYDDLGRQTDAWARNQTGERTTRRQHLVYGTDLATNTVGQIVQHYDEAGLLIVTACDFKGNVLNKVRRVVKDDDLTAAWRSGEAGGWQSLPADTNPHWDILADSRLVPGGYQTTLAYDALNRPIRMTLPAEPGRNNARPELVPTYNRAGALAQATLDGQVLVERVAYNARGQRLLLARGNGLMTRYAYDTVNFRLLRLCTEQYTTAGDTLTPASGSKRQDTAYTYDLAGNIIATTERAPESGAGGTAALTRAFEYDALYRLLEATGRENVPTPGRPWQESTRSEGVASTTAYRQVYQYDLLGNIQQLRHIGQSSFTRTFVYAASRNHLAQVSFGSGPAVAYAYDAVGNVVQENGSRHFAWDAANRLRQYATWSGPAPAGQPAVAPSVLAQYLYDAQGQRTKKLTQTSATTWQVTVYVDGGFEHRYEVTSSTRSADQTTVVVLDGQGRLYQRRSGPDLGDLRPAELYPLADLLGSAAAQTDANGGLVGREEYYPFGETSFGSYAKQRYRFSGKELDQESGLYYYGLRYYAPWLCRFISVDPLAAKFAFYTPYQYAGNKPINAIDLDGGEEKPVADSGGQGSVMPEAVVVGAAPVWRKGVPEFQEKLLHLQDDIVAAHKADNFQQKLGGVDAQLEARLREQVRQTFINDLQEAYIEKKMGWTDWIPIYAPLRKAELYGQMGEKNKAQFQYFMAGADIVLTAADVKGIYTIAEKLTAKAGTGAARAAARDLGEHAGMESLDDGARSAKAPISGAARIGSTAPWEKLKSADIAAEKLADLWGKSADDVGKILGEGWQPGKYGKTGTGWKFTKGDMSIFSHSGGRHVGDYIGFSNGLVGKVKLVASDYLHLAGDKAKVYTFR